MVTSYVLADHEEGWELTRRIREQVDLHAESVKWFNVLRTSGQGRTMLQLSSIIANFGVDMTCGAWIIPSHVGRRFPLVGSRDHLSPSPDIHGRGVDFPLVPWTIARQPDDERLT